MILDFIKPLFELIYDDIYTKMVSSDGQEKYYNGTIDHFNPNNWNIRTQLVL